MRIIFMGTPDFAVPSLESLLAAGHEVCAVVTQPDRPRGRGQRIVFSAVKQFATERNLAILQPEKVRDSGFIEKLEQLKPEAIVVVAFGQILSQQILDIPVHGCINLHGSLLPKYRGAAPIHWAIFNGETETGNTTMLMDKGMDTGAMLLKDKLAIGAEETTGQLHDRLSQSGAKLLVETIARMEKNQLVALKQDDSQTTYAPMLTKEMEIIDWSFSAVAIFNKIRGMNPWPVAYTQTANGRLKILASRLVSHRSGSDLLPGQFAGLSEEGFYIATGDGLLEIIEVQPESRKRMNANVYAAGYGLAGKEIFFGR